MNVFKLIFKEISDRIINLEKVKWVDLWKNQISLIEDDYPFPFPAVFIELSTGNPENKGNNAQDLLSVIDLYVGFETLAETHAQSSTRDKALEFADLLDDIYNANHNKSGTNHSALTFVGSTPVDTGTAIIVYKLSFTGFISAYREDAQSETVTDPGMNIENGEAAVPDPEPPLYDVG